jgi:hypothetical protein
MWKRLPVKYQLFFFRVLMELEFPEQIFKKKKSLSIKVYQNP